MIDPDNLPEQPELLTKVLPSGGALAAGADERDQADENAALAAGRVQATGGGAA